MSFKNKRNLWYVSGNKEGGDIFAHPATEIGENHKIVAPDIAQLAVGEIDGAQRWIVVAQSGKEAVEKVEAFCSE